MGVPSSFSPTSNLSCLFFNSIPLFALDQRKWLPKQSSSLALHEVPLHPSAHRRTHWLTTAGLGLAISKYLLTTTPPNNIIALARSAEPLQTLKNQFPENVEYIAGDLTDRTIGDKAVELALSKFGSLDGLVLNHGVLGQVAVIGNADAELWKHAFDVNLFSLVAFVRPPRSLPPSCDAVIGLVG